MTERPDENKKKPSLKERLPAPIRKHWEKLTYLFFGGCTTLVNIVTMFLLSRAGMNTDLANAIAWLASVLFAYFTNKLFVFENKSFALKHLLREIPSFFGARILTGLLDEAIIHLFVTRLHGNALLWKIISNVIVIILNYFASLLIFARSERKARTAKAKESVHPKEPKQP